MLLYAVQYLSHMRISDSSQSLFSMKGQSKIYFTLNLKKLQHRKKIANFFKIDLNPQFFFHWSEGLICTITKNNPTMLKKILKICIEF